MLVRDLPERFLVAFSFAGEQRDIVLPIAEAVERRLGMGTVFYDDWFESYLAGQNANLRLQRIYHEQCELAVVCISEHYGGKPWALVEYDAILARMTTLRASKVERDQHRMLPIRVGEGEVKDILFTTHVPDVRNRSPEDAAQLIVDKLHRFILGVPKMLSGRPCWPEDPIPFRNGLANRDEREWPAVLRLLSSDAGKRILMFQGPSGYSKSALLDAARKYARAMGIPTAYVDFKDTTLLNELNVLREIQLGLGDMLSDFAVQRNPDRWKLRQALRSQPGAALILFDTFEKAADTCELVEWIETQLLAEVSECEHLRFIIGGQRVPEFSRARWADFAETVELDRITDQGIWKLWVQNLNCCMDEKHIEALVVGLEGVPATISTALKICAQNLTRSV